ncbi:XkdQ/YqbQ family protein [Clostridium saccharobutylicum]|uniref:Lysozyme n=1 Tax=Clostridium saccharobutylicum DSM 13864 TaxID=1345695 RepID=U5MUD6_CLOSA|nr:NlpC/P60 family protein [Clostridium saccharobutylicum]AGX43276.1 hypothetical protein CLSA_c23010 [Clostridium saccharobutylicum DSM 13864]AQR90576.1 putative endopeptidase YafL precursor [Clostridium saccharobutylicum]AQS00480.1 putative endopeptidase YafL precursor [Clostridium saccharobutylicum]AQS10130.1 putative endopeptidase YafL precursor [Clostridium saccharobutylicum]AQS14463.1 putative endopeptidase YafL precursor [Clostridium saccharobutylicum]
MKDILLRRTKWDTGSQRNITDNCISVKLSNSFKQISAELEVDIIYNEYTMGQGMELGDTVELFYKNELIFKGKIVDTDDKVKGSVMKFTAYDYSWWICKSNITKNFTSVSVDEAIREILYDIGAFYDVSDGLGDGGKIVLKNHLVKDKPVHKVLYTIFSEATKNTGKYYYMHMNPEGLITVTEADKYYSKRAIKYHTLNAYGRIDGNVIDAEITESMQNMITQIAVFDEKGEKVKMYADDEKGDTVNMVSGNIDINRFGIIQDTMTMSSDDTNVSMMTKAQNKLTEKATPETTVTVTCWGDMNYKVAYGVLLEMPNRKKYDNVFMYIIDSEWTWNKDDSFISKLGLAPSNKHELYEWSDIEEKQASTSNNGKDGTSSDLCNRIIAELKKWIGTPYYFSCKDPYNYPGMDCSGYVSFVYNQFSSELDINSSNGQLDSYTVTMMEQGKDVTSDFPDNLKECDIIFPHSQHVIAYIGDGQTIEEPKTGDVCKIAPLREKVLKVIRVVPDSAWTTTTDNGSGGDTTGTFSGGVSDQLVEFIKGWEGYYSTAYDDGGGVMTIGYGTTDPSKVAQGTCTESEATEWLKNEINDKASELKSHLESASISLTQNQYDACADFCYNAGFGGLQKSGLWDFAIGKTSKSSSEAWNVYLHDAKGHYLVGLKKRRDAEQAIWDSADYSGRP